MSVHRIITYNGYDKNMHTNNASPKRRERSKRSHTRSCLLLLIELQNVFKDS